MHVSDVKVELELIQKMKFILNIKLSPAPMKHPGPNVHIARCNRPRIAVKTAGRSVLCPERIMCLLG